MTRRIARTFIADHLQLVNARRADPYRQQREAAERAGRKRWLGDRINCDTTRIHRRRSA